MVFESMDKTIMNLVYRRGYDKNKMLLLILSSMYDQYREGYGASWF
jgi:hypothetical protein